jgi:hypothetical protein
VNTVVVGERGGGSLVDGLGWVQPVTRGLSVTPDDPKWLPPHVRPPALGGRGKLPVFVLEVAALNEGLTARRDPGNPHRHAFVEPSAAVSVPRLQELLCSGRMNWEEVRP